MNKSKHSIGTEGRTGGTCPESGVWQSQSTPSTTIPLAKGNKFPPYNKKAVTWLLKSYA